MPHSELNNLDWRQSVIGQSPAIAQICDIIELVAAKRCTILILGESGTGKEVIARAIHAASQRWQSPMVAVNCTALPGALIETELFGHAKGAFTGAHSNRIGRFEQANKGSIFLDEIGDLPLDAQAKLLRVLQEQEFQRVGSSETIRVDVRVIAASNVDLENAIRERRFREDLFYRLNVVPIHLPPLRERREDIPLLLGHFLDKIGLAEDLPAKQISTEAVQFLQSLEWPGNVRQLEHAVQMASALSGDRQLLFPDDFMRRRPVRAEQRASGRRPLITLPSDGLDFDEVVGQLELSLLEQALTAAGGNKARAASLLNIKRTTLLAKMKSFEDRSARFAQTEFSRHSSNTKIERTALVCEEFDPVRQLISKTLTTEGYRILEAATPGVALELFECWGPEIVMVIANSQSRCGNQDLISQIRARVPDMLAVLLSDARETSSQWLGSRTQIVPRPFQARDLTLALRALQAEDQAIDVICA